MLLLTRSAVIPHLSKEVTTQGKGYPTQVEIGTAGNSEKASEALHTLPRERLKRFIGELPLDEL